MKNSFIFALLILFIASFIFLNYKYQTKKTPQATINNHVFNLAIAKTDHEQEMGLAKYKNIPQDFGMLFPFGKPGLYSFWMKNMKFPIDIIFIENNKIVTIFKNIPAPTSDNERLAIYQTEKPADMVLEINAGLSKKYNFQKENIVNITY